jgi:hypothetical protein
MSGPERGPEDREAFEVVLVHAWNMTRDVSGEVDEILRAGRENPPAPEEARRLRLVILGEMRKGAEKRGDTRLLERVVELEKLWGKDG